MKVKVISLLRPLPLSLIASGIGTAVTVLVLGVPELWTAEAAGWASAIATTAAVFAALWIADRQVDVAREAAATEREAGLHIQRAEHDFQLDAARRRSIRLAHVFSRELGYARRNLAVAVINWAPERMKMPTPLEVEGFVDAKPLADLNVISAFSGDLEGFDDADAFAILTVLTSWNFYNSSPRVAFDEINAMPPDIRERVAAKRCRFDVQLFDEIGGLINRLERYYGDHHVMIGSVPEVLPASTKAEFEKLRAKLPGHAL